MNIQHLPSETLKKVAGYLTFPSQAIVAVALATPLSRFIRMITYDTHIAVYKEIVLSQVSKEIIKSAIIGSHDGWDTVDFGEIESSLAARLSDDDIESIFVSILRCELGHRVRSVLFTGCTGIKGHCVRPLRHFSNLVQVDLSLVGRRSGTDATDICTLEQDAVVETLNVHLRTWGGLKLVRLPEKFRLNETAEMDQFLLRLSESIEQRWGECSKCDAKLSIQGGKRVKRAIILNEEFCFTKFGHQYYGRSSTCCARCLNDFCFQDSCTTRFCDNCGSAYCDECGSFDRCCGCSWPICINCREVSKVGPMDTRCDKCKGVFCRRCLEFCPSCNRSFHLSCAEIHRCHRCNKQSCDQCRIGMELNIRWCEDGDHSLCKQCLVGKCVKDGVGGCESCMELIADDVLATVLGYSKDPRSLDP